MRRGRELDPLNPMAYATSSQVDFQARNYAAPLEGARRALALDPEFWIGYIMQAQALDCMNLADRRSRHAGRFSGQNSKTVSFRGPAVEATGRYRSRRASRVTVY
jgi:hypothetical protein